MKIINSSKKRKLPRITWYEIVKILVVLVFVGLTVYLYVSHLPEKENVSDQTVVPTEVPAPTPAVDPTYITETCYDGTQELDPILFHFSFEKSHFYIQNKKLVLLYLDDDAIQELQEDAANFAANYYHMNLDDFSRDYDNQLTTFRNLFLEDSLYFDLEGHLLDTDQYTDDLIRTVYNAKWQNQVEFETDKSLVWQDDAYYVRGFLTIHTYKIKDDADLSQFFPFRLGGNQDIKAVIDIGLVPGITNYQVVSIDYVWLSEEG